MAPRHERMLDATRRNVARLKMLIDDLLTLQQAEGSNQQMECVDLTGLVRDVVMDVKLSAARRGFRIGVDVPASSPYRCSRTGRCSTAPSSTSSPTP